MPNRRGGGYPAPMIGDFNPVQSLSLTVVTSQLVIQGTLRTRLRHLTDVLNEPDCKHLILFDATFMEIGSRRVVADAVVAEIQVDDLLFLHTNDTTESAQALRTPKQAISTILLAPPFTIEGEIHLPMETELHQALGAFEERFVPVTNARYWAYGVAESPNHVDLLVVNHVRAHVAVPSGVVWKTDGPAGMGSRGSGSNPW
jgi:hypothetical protein